MLLFNKPNAVSGASPDETASKPQQPSGPITPERIRQLLDEIEADEQAASAIEPVGQSNTQWAAAGGRRRITRAEAETIKRRIIGPRRRFFTLAERREFLEQYEVISDGEPLPPPTSTTSQAEFLEARSKPKQPAPAKPPNRLLLAARVLLGAAPPADAPEAAEPKKPAPTFFS